MDIATMFYIIFSGLLWGFGFLCLFLMSPVNDFFKRLETFFEELYHYRIAKKPDLVIECFEDKEHPFLTCPSCHYVLSENQAFCSLCGQKILWEKESEEKLNE